MGITANAFVATKLYPKIKDIYQKPLFAAERESSRERERERILSSRQRDNNLCEYDMCDSTTKTRKLYRPSLHHSSLYSSIFAFVYFLAQNYHRILVRRIYTNESYVYATFVNAKPYSFRFQKKKPYSFQNYTNMQCTCI